MSQYIWRARVKDRSGQSIREERITVGEDDTPASQLSFTDEEATKINRGDYTIEFQLLKTIGKRKRKRS